MPEELPKRGGIGRGPDEGQDGASRLVGRGSAFSRLAWLAAIDFGGQGYPVTPGCADLAQSTLSGKTLGEATPGGVATSPWSWM